jgi:hypothetical protein
LLTAFGLGFPPHVQRKACTDLHLRAHAIDVALHLAIAPVAALLSMIGRIQLLYCCLRDAFFALITPCFGDFEIREWDALVELFDPGDELRGESNPLSLCNGKKLLMLAAILESHTSSYSLSFGPLLFKKSLGEQGTG